MPLNPKITVTTGGIHGNCWFANADIPKGEWLWKAGEWDFKTECVVPIETVQQWPEDVREKFLALAYQINPREYSGFPPGMEVKHNTITVKPHGEQVPEEVVQENYVNHTCDGNGWYEGDHLLVACKDIKKGEEIAYDYALTEADPTFILNCRCNSPNCRKTVTGLDYQRKDLQEKYGNHFLPYILEKINKQ